MSRLASLIVLILYSTTLCNTSHQQIVGQNDTLCKASDVQERNCTTTGTPPDTRSSSTDHSRGHSNHVAKNFSKCGQSSTMLPRKILGGYHVQSGDWPWIVALGYRRGTNTTILWQCEGTLISDTWVITAAHCVQGMGSLVLTTVRAGDLDLNDEVKDGASPVDIKVSQSIVHPEFLTRPPINDIALLRLNSSIKFNENISAICLLNKEEYKSDKVYERKIPYYVVGWTLAYTQQESSRSKMIQEFEVEIEDVKTCSEKYKSEGYHDKTLINERVLCANHHYHNKDSCYTDSKGPMMIPHNGSIYLAGISSYGLKCSHLPAVYTRVAYFTDWIRNTTGI
ncbi:venom protease-like [Planococcus citri]|uniref:venom protease-like n=1 Tax=Planococcus citri TaxID=170843 RepID=UPI0031F81EF9